MVRRTHASSLGSTRSIRNCHRSNAINIAPKSDQSTRLPSNDYTWQPVSLVAVPLDSSTNGRFGYHEMARILDQMFDCRGTLHF